MFSQSSHSAGLDTLFNRPAPSLFQQFWTSPTLFLARKLYAWHSSRTVVPFHPLSSQSPAVVSVICLSDTHNTKLEPSSIPDGDLLIHAGDLTNSGTFSELQSTLDWINSLPHPHKIVIAGNHDILLDPLRDRSPDDAAQRAKLSWGSIVYLRDSSTTLLLKNGRKLKVYGSPRTPKSGNWAFEYQRSEEEEHMVWTEKVPDDTDILVTHGPPKGHLDSFMSTTKNSGCAGLLREVWRVRPRLHVFGHIHAGRGIESVCFDGVQEGYEAVVAGLGGGLMKVITGVFRGLFTWRRVEAKTMFVNAAVVGGVRDELRRGALKVVI